jgi:Tfp pilus assembly protein PilO
VKRNQIIILASFAAGLALLCFLSWQFLFQTVRKEMIDQRSQLEAAIKELEEAKSKAAQHEKFMAEAENVRRGVNFVTARLDPHLPFSEIVGMFLKIGNELNVKQLSIIWDINTKIVISKDEAGLSSIDVKINFISDYNTLGQYINMVNSQKRIVNLTDIKLESNDPTGRKGALKATLTFRLFLRTPPPEAAK